VELPVLGRQLRGELQDPLLVVLVGEERAVAATAVVLPARDDAVAAPAEDARPPGTKPRHVRTDDVAVVGGVGELDPLPREIEGDLCDGSLMWGGFWTRHP